MKPAWAALVAVTLLAGCRSAQPTTNPFLRTTVAPPPTGSGAVVVTQGDPYSPSGAPVATAPMVSPAGPAGPPVITPAPVAAPVVAPQPAMPPKDKFGPPGGSFLYNQSSLDKPRATKVAKVSTGTKPASAADTLPPERLAKASLNKPRKTPGTVVQLASALEDDDDQVVTAGYHEAAPSDTPQTVTGGAKSKANNAVRLVAHSEETVVPQASLASEADEGETFRLTVGPTSSSAAASAAETRNPSRKVEESKVAFVEGNEFEDADIPDADLASGARPGGNTMRVQ